MNFADLEHSMRVRPAFVFGALGLVSGLASAIAGPDVFNLEALRPLGMLFGLAPELLPIGFYFGAALALGLWGHTGRLIAFPVVLITTMYAWSAAIQIAIRLQRNAGDDLHLIAASLGAGALGAGLTHVGCAFIAPALRQPMRIAATALVGAVAGMLFYLGEREIVSEYLLYIVWQPAVAFCIGSFVKPGAQAA